MWKILWATAKSTLHTMVKNFGAIKLMAICNAYLKWIQPPSQAEAMHSSIPRGSEYKGLVSPFINPGQHLPLAEHAQPGNLPSHHLLQPLSTEPSFPPRRLLLKDMDTSGGHFAAALI